MGGGKKSSESLYCLWVLREKRDSGRETEREKETERNVGVLCCSGKTERSAIECCVNLSLQRQKANAPELAATLLFLASSSAPARTGQLLVFLLLLFSTNSLSFCRLQNAICPCWKQGREGGNLQFIIKYF